MKFLATDESVRLARWLRLMGYDTALSEAQPLSALYERAFNENRVIVTRDRDVKAGYWLRVIQLDSGELAAQLKQLVTQLELSVDWPRVGSRCDVCNAEVERAEKAFVQDKVPPYVWRTQKRFFECPSCHRIYWPATHWQRIQTFLHQI